MKAAVFSSLPQVPRLASVAIVVFASTLTDRILRNRSIYYDPLFSGGHLYTV